MSNVLRMIFISLLVFVFIGCGGGSSDKKSSTIDNIQNPNDNFAITGNDVNSSGLKIQGLSKDENNTVGTKGLMTDVVAVDESDKVVYRSFNVGKWKGKLNDETTLLSYIFLDGDLLDLSDDEKAEIAEKLLDTYPDDIANMIDYQDLQKDNPFFAPYFIKLVGDFRQKALNIVSEQLSSRKISRSYNTNNETHKIGFMDVSTANGLNLQFSNYLNVYYGLEPYEIDGVKQNIQHHWLDASAMIIDPVPSGGVSGGLYAWVRNKLYFKDTGSFNYDDLDEDDDKSFEDINKMTLQIYKWQYGYPSVLNVANAIGIVTEAAISVDYAKEVKEKFSSAFNAYEKAREYMYKIDNGIQAYKAVFLTFNTLVDIYNETADPDEKINIDFKAAINNDVIKTYDELRKNITRIATLFPDIKYDNNIKIDLSKLLDVKYLLVPDKTVNNSFNANYDNLYANIEDDNKKKLDMLYGYVMLAMNSLIEKKYSKNIAEFNEKYKKCITFKQMHFLASFYMEYNSKNGKRTTLYKIFNENGQTLTSAMQDYYKSIVPFMLKDVAKSAGGVAWDMISSGFKDAKNLNKTLLGYNDLLSNNIDSKNAIRSLGIYIMKIASDSVDNIAASALENLVVNAIGGGGYRIIRGADKLASWIAGNFVTPNLQYIYLENDNGTIQFYRPPFSIIGLESGNINIKESSSNFINKEPYNNSYLIAVDEGDTYISHRQAYNIYFFQSEGSEFKTQMLTLRFPEDEFLNFDFYIRKSNDNTLDGTFEEFGTNANENHDISLKTTDMFEGTIKRVNDVSYVDLFEIWGKQQGNGGAVYTKHETRGLFQNYISLKMNQPYSSKIQIPTETKSNSTFMYKAYTGKKLGENIQVERFSENGFEKIRFENNNDFDVVLAVYWDSQGGTIDIKGVDSFDGDILIKAHSVYTTSLSKYKDNNGDFNEVRFVLYDILAQNFFEDIGVERPTLYNYTEQYSYPSAILYELKIENIPDGKFLLFKDVTKLAQDGTAIVTFSEDIATGLEDMEVYIYDTTEETLYRKLGTNDYSISKSKQNVTIKINNPASYASYKVIVPNTITSTLGHKLSDKEVFWLHYEYEVSTSPTANKFTLYVKEDSTDNIIELSATGEELEYEIVSKPTGTLTHISGNTFSYDAKPYDGEPDKIIFKVIDKYGNKSNMAQVTIYIESSAQNTAPKAYDQSTSVQKGQSVKITLQGTDNEENSLTYSIVSDVSHGRLIGTPPNVTYKPATDFVGDDSFTYKVNDGTEDSNEATVSISVTDATSTNTAPVATTQNTSVQKGQSVKITLQGTDDDGDSLTYSIVSDVSHGRLLGTPPNVTYKPNANYTGNDSFTFKVNDGTEDSSEAIVSIIVNDTTPTPTSTSKVLKTGQTKSYTNYDDGYYQKGLARSYSRSGNIVTDNTTKLQWQDDEAAKTTKKNWEGAKTYCSDLTLDGYGDWRLPSIQELLSITDLGKYNPAIDSTFQNTKSRRYWSSTTYASSTLYAWYVEFYGGGHDNCYDKSAAYIYVRCVRAGQ